MDNQTCIQQLLEAESSLKECAFGPETKCFAVARVGFGNQRIRAGTMKQISEEEMGEPLHSVVVCAQELHCLEEEMYQFYS
jgi:diphthine synthase